MVITCQWPLVSIIIQQGQDILAYDNKKVEKITVGFTASYKSEFLNKEGKNVCPTMSVLN